MNLRANPGGLPQCHAGDSPGACHHVNELGNDVAEMVMHGSGDHDLQVPPVVGHADRGPLRQCADQRFVGTERHSRKPQPQLGPLPGGLGDRAHGEPPSAAHARQPRARIAAWAAGSATGEWTNGGLQFCIPWMGAKRESLVISLVIDFFAAETSPVYGQRRSGAPLEKRKKKTRPVVTDFSFLEATPFQRRWRNESNRRSTLASCLARAGHAHVLLIEERGLARVDGPLAG